MFGRLSTARCYPNPHIRACLRGKSVPFPARRGLRIEHAADYTGLSPFYIEEMIRCGRLPAIGGRVSDVSRGYIVTREHLDELLDTLFAEAEKAQKKQKAEAA